MNLANVRLRGSWVAALGEAENARTGVVKLSALVGYGITRVLTCPGAQAGVSAGVQGQRTRAINWRATRGTRTSPSRT